MGYVTEVLANEILESIFMNDFNVSGYIHANVYQHPFEASVVSQSVSQSVNRGGYTTSIPSKSITDHCWEVRFQYLQSLATTSCRTTTTGRQG